MLGPKNNLQSSGHTALQTGQNIGTAFFNPFHTSLSAGCFSCGKTQLGSPNSSHQLFLLCGYVFLNVLWQYCLMYCIWGGACKRLVHVGMDLWRLGNARFWGSGTSVTILVSEVCGGLLLYLVILIFVGYLHGQWNIRGYWGRNATLVALSLES